MEEVQDSELMTAINNGHNFVTTAHTFFLITLLWLIHFNYCYTANERILRTGQSYDVVR
jgi:hypothetical protein